MQKLKAEKKPYPRWYKGEKFEYEQRLKTKGRIITHFKTTITTRGGHRVCDRFYRVFENGMCFYIDMTMWKMSVTQSYVPPFGVRACTKREFDKAFKKFIGGLL